MRAISHAHLHRRAWVEHGSDGSARMEEKISRATVMIWKRFRRKKIGKGLFCKTGSWLNCANSNIQRCDDVTGANQCTETLILLPPRHPPRTIPRTDRDRLFESIYTASLGRARQSDILAPSRLVLIARTSKIVIARSTRQKSSEAVIVKI